MAACSCKLVLIVLCLAAFYLLAATDSFLDQDDFAKLHRIFSSSKNATTMEEYVHQNNDIMNNNHRPPARL